MDKTQPESPKENTGGRETTSEEEPETRKPSPSVVPKHLPRPTRR